MGRVGDRLPRLLRVAAAALLLSACECGSAAEPDGGALRDRVAPPDDRDGDVPMPTASLCGPSSNPRFTAGTAGYGALSGSELAAIGGARPGGSALGVLTTTSGGGVFVELAGACAVVARRDDGTPLDVAVRFEAADLGLFRGDDAAPARVALVAMPLGAGPRRILAEVTLDSRTTAHGVIVPREAVSDALRLELVVSEANRRIALEAFEVFVVELLDEGGVGPVIANGAFHDGLFGWSMEGRPRLVESAEGTWALLPVGSGLSQELLSTSVASRFDVRFRALSVEGAGSAIATLTRLDGTEVDRVECSVPSDGIANCTGVLERSDVEPVRLRIAGAGHLAVHGIAATEAP